LLRSANNWIAIRWFEKNVCAETRSLQKGVRTA
jgi:hypothetical protein